MVGVGRVGKGRRGGRMGRERGEVGGTNVVRAGIDEAGGCGVACVVCLCGGGGGVVGGAELDVGGVEIGGDASEEVNLEGDLVLSRRIRDE